MLSLYERKLAYSLMYRELLCFNINYGYIFCHESRLAQCGSGFASVLFLYVHKVVSLREWKYIGYWSLNLHRKCCCEFITFI